VSGPRADWQPREGERVRVVATGRIGTVVHRTLTEWGWLCDLVYEETAERRTHTVPELEPIERPRPGPA
jgi:hypothetical protein